MNMSINSVSGKRQISYKNSFKINEPDWSVIPSKNMPQLSKAEFESQLKKLVQQCADAATPEDISRCNSAKEKLMAQYISPVSPERKELFDKAVEAINNKPSKAKKNYDKSFLDYLDERDGVAEKTDAYGNPIKLSGKDSMTAVENPAGGYTYNVASNGETVLTFNNASGAVSCPLTAAELKKQDEFNKLFSFNSSLAGIKADGAPPNRQDGTRLNIKV